MFLLVVRDEVNKDTELEPRFSQARASFKPIGVCHMPPGHPYSVKSSPGTPRTNNGPETRQLPKVIPVHGPLLCLE